MYFIRCRCSSFTRGLNNLNGLTVNLQRSELDTTFSLNANKFEQPLHLKMYSPLANWDWSLPLPCALFKSIIRYTRKKYNILQK